MATAAPVVHAIKIDPHKSGGVTIAPAGYLGGSNFGRYLEAVRSVPGITYDAANKCQRMRDVSLLPQLLAALQNADFGPIVHPDLLAIPAAVADALGEQRERAQRAMDAAIARIASAGLAPFPYQKDGIQWLAVQDAALLADEMGLGKTVQTLLALPEKGYTIVVCPASLKGNWASECRRWRPDLRFTILGGVGSFRWARAGEVVIINDDVLPELSSLMIPPPGTVLVYDECHRSKGGKKTRRGKRFLELSKAVREQGGRVWLLTGTPLINRPPELKNVLDLAGLFEKAYGSWSQFVRAFNGRKDRFGFEWGVPDPEAAEGLRRVALARRRADVLPDLPTKRWETIAVDIESEALLAQLNTIQGKLESQGINVFQMDRSVLKEPALFEMMSKIRAELAKAMIPAMLEIVERAEDEEQALVVFSAHRAPIDLLGQREGWATITGDTDPLERNGIVERFQRGELKGIAGTIKAMGVGVTLTYSHWELFVDLDWTPAGNSQAEDRVCRIGQKNAVLISTLTGNHPLIERVNELLQDKAVIIDGSVGAAARGKQTQASDLLAELASREEQARAAAASLSALAEKGAEKALKSIEDQEKDRTALHTEVQSLIAGGYALLEEGGTISFWRVDRPDDRSRWQGWTFLARQAGPEKHSVGGVKPDGTATARDGRAPEHTAAVIRRILADPDAMARYGRELGVCGRCGLELTDEDSRRIGLGPICRSK